MSFGCNTWEDRVKVQASEMLVKRKMKRIKRIDKVRNQEIVAENGTLLDIILKKAIADSNGEWYLPIIQHNTMIILYYIAFEHR